MIVVEQMQPSRDRGFLPELPYDEYACRDINALGASRCEGLGPERRATHSYGSMEASQWAVDLCSVI